MSWEEKDQERLEMWEQRKKVEKEKKSAGVESRATVAHLCWPVFFEVITGWLETLRAGQWTSHAAPHTFKPVSLCRDVCRRLTHQRVGITGMFLACRFCTYQGKTCVMTTCHVRRPWFVCVCIIRVRLTKKVQRNEAFDWQTRATYRKVELLNFYGKHKGFEGLQESEKDKSDDQKSILSTKLYLCRIS